MKSFLASVALALFGGFAAVHAQIELERQHPLGSPIVARSTVDIPKGARVAYDWKPGTSGCSVVPLEGGRVAHIWACPGKHTIDLVVAVAGDKAINVDRYEADFLVGSAPPTPIDETLADLVSKESAELLADFHADWSAAVPGKLTSRENFDRAYQSTRDALRLEDANQAYTVVDQRLTQVKGFAEELAAALQAIAAEFGGEPTPDPDPPEPEPTTGPRVVLIVHETKDDTPDFSAMIVELRKEGGIENEWIRNQGHRLYVLDDDMTDQNGEQPGILTRYSKQISDTGLPAMLVIEPETEKLISVRKLQDGVTASNITEYIRQAGG